MPLEIVQQACIQVYSCRQAGTFFIFPLSSFVRRKDDDDDDDDGEHDEEVSLCWDCQVAGRGA